ncbi:hypothetical protein ACJ73_07634, partial [Blastomyces percursus]
TVSNRKSKASIRRSLTKLVSIKRNPKTKLLIRPRSPQKPSGSSQPPRLSLPDKLPSRSHKKDRNDAFRECVICAEMKPLGRNGSNFPTFPRCLYDPLTCSNCVSKHIVMTLKTRAPINHSKPADKGTINWSLCTCPQCNIPLTEWEIRSVLSRTENAVITGVAARKELESLPRWTWCLSITC